MIAARRVAASDRAALVAGAGILHDEHTHLVEFQMKVGQLAGRLE